MKLLFAVLLFAAVIAAKAATASNGSTTRILVALTHRNRALLEVMLSEVSDPKSDKYNQPHLTRDEIAEIIAPLPEDVELVIEWLRSTTQQQIKDIQIHDSRDFLSALVPTSYLPSLRSDRQPAKIAKLIDHISEFTTSPSAIKAHREATALQCNQALARAIAQGEERASRSPAVVSGTPDNQRKSYDIPENLKGTNKKNSQLVWGPCTYGVLDSDLKKFYETFDVKGASINDIVRDGYHGFPGGDNFGEATLDTEYISGIAPGVKTIVSNTNNSATTEEGNGFGDALLQFVSDLASKSEVPYVISMSLGSLSWGSIDLMCTQANRISNGKVTYAACQAYLQSQRQVSMYTGYNQISRIDTEFMKLGLRGVTLLAAAGDGGSHFSFLKFPSGPIGDVLNNVSCQYQMPTYPASSPYVLAVGGTQWGKDIKKPEHWPSGGSGFSWQFDMPDYQRSFVEKYLKEKEKELPPASSFNRTHRAYPDISAVGANVPVVMQGKVYSMEGTSASTPEMAGLISLINDHRLNKGLKPLGFVNKRLYDIADKHYHEAFYDITSGKTNCDIEGFCCDNGFPAAEGWDPVTGLGSPVFPGLLKYLGSDDVI